MNTAQQHVLDEGCDWVNERRMGLGFIINEQTKCCKDNKGIVQLLEAYNLKV